MEDIPEDYLDLWIYAKTFWRRIRIASLYWILYLDCGNKQRPSRELLNKGSARKRGVKREDGEEEKDWGDLVNV